MDEISQGPKRDFRLPSGRWLVVVVVVAAGLIAVIATLVLTGSGGRRAAGPPGGSTALAAPSLTAAPGTVLLTCDSANWGQLASNWRAGSLRG